MKKIWRKKYPDSENRPSFDPAMWSKESGGLSKPNIIRVWN